jgi:nuclear GTP-binding protein
VAHIVSRADTEDLMLFYNLPAFTKGDTNAFLSGVARSNGMVKKVCAHPVSFETNGV